MRHFPKLYDYVNLTQCISEVSELRNLNKCYLVGLPYTYMHQATVKVNKRSIEFRYKMSYDEENLFDHNRLDIAQVFDFRFINDHKVYSIKQSNWFIKRVTPFGYFSKEQPWNLEWDVFRFTRGDFPDISEKSKLFFRYISMISEKIDFLRDFEHYIKNIGLRSWTTESIRITIGCEDFSVYKTKVNESTFLVIDNLTPITLNHFDQCVTSLLFTIGFIEQTIHLDASYTFVIDHPKTGNVKSMRYASLRGTITGQYPIFTTNAYSVRMPIGSLYGFDGDSDINVWMCKLQPFSKCVLDKLASLIYNYPILANCIAILVGGSKSGLEIQGASFSVVLETITSLIEKEKLVPIIKAKPVVDKSAWKKLRKEYLRLLEKANLSEEEKNFIMNKLNNLNQITNRDKLMAPFSALGVKLSQKELDTIERRNDFLHGRNDCGVDSDSMNRMVWICRLFHQLCCILLFKLAGFSGYIIDQTAFEVEIGSVLNSKDGFRLI